MHCLLHHKADINALNKCGTSVLTLAAKEGNVTLTWSLLQQPKINKKVRKTTSAPLLIWAIYPDDSVPAHVLKSIKYIRLDVSSTKGGSLYLVSYARCFG